MTMYPDLPYIKVDGEMPDLGYARPGDAGLDLCTTKSVDISPQGMVKVGTGVRCAIPEGFVGLIVPRSSIATKRGITVINTPGTIDSGYRGEIMLPLYNMSTETQSVRRGERVAQMIILAYAIVNPVLAVLLPESERGENGFGSTGTFGMRSDDDGHDAIGAHDRL